MELTERLQLMVDLEIGISVIEQGLDDIKRVSKRLREDCLEEIAHKYQPEGEKDGSQLPS